MTTIAAWLVAALLVPPAGADVLWDQSNYDTLGAGFFDSVSGSPPFGLTTYTVGDITVGGSGWHVDKITTYYTRIDPNWGIGITQGYLNLFPKTGSLPVDGADDPTAGTPVALTSTSFDDRFEISAAGLNLELAPGEYWIGITPVAPSGFFGPEIHMSSLTFLGDASASYDPFAFPGPPAWFLFNPGVDAAMLIEGTPHGPLAVAPSTWGDVKALYR
jgi:hypothetical protein